MKNAFDGLISILDMAEERISELEDTSIKIFKNWKQIEHSLKKEKQIKNIQGLWNNLKKKYNISIMRIS